MLGFFIGDKNAGSGVRVAEAWRRSVKHRDDFVWLGGQFAGLMGALAPPSSTTMYALRGIIGN